MLVFRTLVILGVILIIRSICRLLLYQGLFYNTSSSFKYLSCFWNYTFLFSSNSELFIHMEVGYTHKFVDVYRTHFTAGGWFNQIVGSIPPPPPIHKSNRKERERARGMESFVGFFYWAWSCEVKYSSSIFYRQVSLSRRPFRQSLHYVDI